MFLWQNVVGILFDSKGGGPPLAVSHIFAAIFPYMEVVCICYSQDELCHIDKIICAR